MTPADFDEIYFELAQRLGSAPDPGLVRDRLLLLLLQQLDRAAALKLMDDATDMRQAVALAPIVMNHQ